MRFHHGTTISIFGKERTLDCVQLVAVVHHVFVQDGMEKQCSQSEWSCVMHWSVYISKHSKDHGRPVEFPQSITKQSGMEELKWRARKNHDLSRHL